MATPVGSKGFFAREIGEVDLSNILDEDRIWNLLEREGSLGEPEKELNWIDYENGETKVFGRKLEETHKEVKLPSLDFSNYSEKYNELSDLLQDLADMNPEKELIVWTGKALGQNAIEAASETIETYNSSYLDEPAFVLLSDLDRKRLQDIEFGPEYEGDSLDIHEKFLGDDVFHVETTDGTIGRAGTISSDPTAILYHMGNNVYRENYEDETNDFLKYLDEGFLEAAREYQESI